jgi:hypothetical protein
MEEDHTRVARAELLLDYIGKKVREQCPKELKGVEGGEKHD